MGNKRYLVVMTNGDTYTVSDLGFNKVTKAMQEQAATVRVIDVVSSFWLTLQVANISATVERTGGRDD